MVLQSDYRPLRIHGKYPANWKGLNFDQLAKINTAVENGKDREGKGYDPRKLLKPGFDAITAKVINLCKAFGAANQA